MTSKKIYFASKDRGLWVPCPAINAGLNMIGWSNSGTYLNGGGFNYTSETRHKEYVFTWNLAPQEDIDLILDFDSGVHGPGPYYFIEPFAMELNVMSEAWSMPYKAGIDGPSIIREIGQPYPVRPKVVATPANPNMHPTRSAQYQFIPGYEFAKFTIPIPPGYTLYLGVHGTAAGSAQPVVVYPDGSDDSIGVIPLNGPISNFDISGVAYIDLTFGGVGMLTIASITARLFKTGTTIPINDNFISGKGNSGVRFSNTTRQGYSAALDKQGAATTLIEVGSWE